MAASSAFTLPCSIQDTGVKLRDDQFHNLKKVFLAEGRGRRPNIHDVTPTNSLLMQIYLLREDGGKSYDEAAAFVQHLFPDLTFNKIRHMIAHVRTRWESFKDSEKQEKFLKEEFDTSGVGLHLRNCGLTRRKILEADCQLSTSSDSTVQFLSAGLFLDLDDFRRQENKTFQDMCTWWSNLTAQSVGVSEMKKMAKAANRKRDKTAKADK